MKRWVNLRCIVKEQFQGLHVFPDKCVVCASLSDCNSKPWATKSGIQQEKSFSGTSEYFTGAAKNGQYTQRKQVILKELIKKISTTTMKKTLGAEDYETEYRKCEHLTSSNSQSETKCRHAGQPINDYKNTAESNLEPPGSEMENYVNQRQPDDASSQQNPHFVERLEAELLDRNSSWSCESAPPDPKQSQGSTIMQQKQNRHYSEEKQDFCKKASFGKNIFIPWEMVMKERNASSLMPATEKSLLNPMSSNVLVEASSNEELLTLNSIPLRPVLMKNTMEHTNQNKPATDTQELPLIPTSSHLKINHSPLEELFQESKKGIENQPRRLKLQRFKKS
ncbi:protein SLX4IP isoform X3 [Rhinatrema bivittatum]|nr:protein SLX4IP isoform X3 [Rhinatrema bivittatum]XP_029449397.1 protein SLX4IP isoform X3 [Rhinatrema bivittatum]